MSESIVVQQPAAAARQLVLLFHGVGSDAASMVPLGEALAAVLPRAWVVSVPAPDLSDLGRGRQWFSVKGITESNRRGRVDEALPLFRQAVGRWQHTSAVGPQATALVGFSQGAIMSLEASIAEPALCAEVVAIAGRFVQLPAAIARGTHLHLIHGDADPVVACAHTLKAAPHLAGLGVAVSSDILTGLGHQVERRVAASAVERLKSAFEPVAD